MNLHGYINGNNSSNNKKYEYTYLKDEQLEGKDCILVKEDVFYPVDGEYAHISEIISNRKLRVFWIEKSTGFILGGSSTSDTSNIDNITPETIIRNIAIGNVVDSDFELPKDYKIIVK